LAFARLLLENGCSVIIGDLKLTTGGENLISEFPYPSSDGKPFAVFHTTNVASWPQLTSLWKKALEIFPTINIVIPGAGLYDPPWSSFWQPPRTETNRVSLSIDPADADPGHFSVLDVNLVSPIRLSQFAIAHWTQRKQPGCLLHVGSVAGYLAEAASPLYFASKHGLHGFVRSLADLKDQLGIRVSCVAPGPANVSEKMCSIFYLLKFCLPYYRQAYGQATKPELKQFW
jgi:NAD(P)-dependent dehydrogenase (short-subunit alcohol dehydrogenase family)